jgi:predicted ATPase/DNA-binding CsgD family transcriptional regulator
MSAPIPPAGTAGDAAAPAAPVIGDQSAAALALPTPSLIGREAELAALTDLLARDDVRLLTLVGPGGVGKTALALHLAATVQSTGHLPVTFVPLAWVTDPSLVIPTISQALDVHETTHQSLLDRLTSAFGDSVHLLALDNLEQVLEAAPDLARLLAGSPGLTVLATSRIPLNLYGEHIFRVPPLILPASVPDPAVADLLATGAVRLFVERARAVRTDFALTPRNAAEVAEICRRLDGLPLAIELAAARVRHAPPGNLLARLDRRLPVLTGGPRDQPQRLRTMRDAIAWSYDLLNAGERALFRRLAVFAGGATLAVAEAVCDPDHELTLDVWDGISALVDQSLLVQTDGGDGEPRFEMLQTVREYALEQLEQAGEAVVVRDRHASYFRDLAEHFMTTFAAPVYYQRLAQLRAEHANLRAALDWYEETGDVVSRLRLAGSLAMYWYYAGHLSEGASRIERSLAAAGGVEVPPLVLAQAFACDGLLAQVQGDAARGLASLAEAIRLRRAAGDELGATIAQGFAGGILVSEGRYDEAAPIFEENLAWLRTREEPVWTAHTLFHLGVIAFARRELDRSAELCTEAATLYDAYHSYLDAIDPLRYLGLIACIRHELDEAARLFDENLNRLADRGSIAAFSTGLADVATLATASGDLRQAAMLFGAAEALKAAHGASFSLPARTVYEAAMARIRLGLGTAEDAEARAEGAALSPEQAVSIARQTLLQVMETVPASREPSVLTVRELEVLPLLAAGLTNQQIADQLFVSRGTVRTHVSNILAKLGARGRTEAAALAREQGLLSPGQARSL